MNARRFASRKFEPLVAAYLDDIAKDGEVVRNAYNLKRQTFSVHPKLNLPADDPVFHRYKEISEPASVPLEVAAIRSKVALSKHKFVCMDLEWNSLGSQGPVAIIALGCLVEGDFYSLIFHMPALLKGFCLQSVILIKLEYSSLLLFTF